MSPLFPLAIAMLALCASIPARADVITTHRIMEAGKEVSRSPKTLILASDAALLTQTWNGQFDSDGGASYRRTTTIVQYAKNRVATLDVALKIYKFEPLGSEVPPGTPAFTIRLTRLADEKVLGYNTRHFFVNVLYATSPFANGGTLARQEIWLLPAESRPHLPTQPRYIFDIESIKTSGDTQFLPEVQNGIFIKKSVFDSAAPDVTPAKIVYTEEISALSIGDIAPANFEIPSDYRELSPAQFAAALQNERREALEKKMEEIDRQANAT